MLANPSAGYDRSRQRGEVHRRRWTGPRQRVDDERGATFSVTDTGIGIKEQELGRVFQRFFRGETARSRTDGAGLGLSIASWIAREHNATISLTSEPGKGTKVVVTFPRAVTAAVSS
jgi:signal transduction histidine kinase